MPVLTPVSTEIISSRSPLGPVITMIRRSTTSGFWLQDGAFALKKISFPTSASNVGSRKLPSTKPRIISGGLTIRQAFSTALNIPTVFVIDAAELVNCVGEPAQVELSAPTVLPMPFTTSVHTATPEAIAKLLTEICDGAFNATCPEQPGS